MMDTLLQALRPLSAPPEDPAWNHAEMNEWLGDQARLPAAVLLGIREGVQPRLVFTVRDARLPAHAGQVAFPGGRAERVAGRHREALHEAFSTVQRAARSSPSRMAALMPFGSALPVQAMS